MNFKYPFIYIASLIRTGSSVLMEALTKPGYAYVFGEPWFGSNMFENVEMYAEELKQYDIDVRSILIDRPLFSTNSFRTFERRKTALEVFATELAPLLDAKGLQIGVKEVRGYGWEGYSDYFPDTRFVLTGRDPRDLYISCHYLLERSKSWVPWFQPFSPGGLKTELMPSFAIQTKILQTQNAMKLTYEDMCLDSKIYEKVKRFVGSPIPGIGDVGMEHPTLKIEEAYSYGKPLKELDSRSIGRWKKEKNKKLVKDACSFFGIMGDYCKFWGYEE